ncbi:MAG: DUF624 domain-containing protein [Clostridiales bacterium]|nr:DUF624 domain-containing protein [Clostridiales bacterium]
MKLVIFDLDNKFYRGFNKVIDCVIISVVWLVFCIPIFTIGAATTGLYYTVNKSIVQGKGYVWREFWHSFKGNFKQSTLVWLAFLAVGAVLGADTYIMYLFAQSGERWGAFFVVFIVLVAVEVAWLNYVFPYIARFTDTTKNVFKVTSALAFAHLPATFLMLVLFVIVAIVVYLFPPVLVFVPSVYMIGISKTIEAVFKKHMPEEEPEEVGSEEQ